MKTIRTILFTLAAVLVGFGLFALISVNTEPSYVNRTIYWVLDKSFFYPLVIGVAFLLIAIILTISLVAFKDDKTEEDEDGGYEDELDIDLGADDEIQQLDYDSDKPIGEPQRRPMRTSIPSLFTADDDDDVSNNEIKQEKPVSIRPPQRIDEGEEKPARKFQRPTHMGEHKFEPIKMNEAEPEPRVDPVPPKQAEKIRPNPPVRQPIMTRCIYCGELIDKENNFCPSCGRRR